MSEEPVEIPASSDTPRDWRPRLRPAWGLGALALMFFALFAWSELRLREAKERLSVLEAANRSLDEERRRIEMAATAAGERHAAMARASHVAILSGNADGRIYINQEEHSAVALFAKLPQLPPASRYHLWSRPRTGGEPRHIASFAPSPDGSAQVVLHDISLDGSTQVELTTGPSEQSTPGTAPVLLSGVL